MISPLEIGLVILLIIVSGAVLGMLIGQRLPSHHLSSETKTLISASMAVLGTMSALMLGLLIANSSSAFSTRSGEITRVSADIIRLDRLLRRYGPEASVARAVLQRYAAMKVDDLFPAEAGRKPQLENPASVQMLERLQDMILALRPGDARQRWLSGQALQLAAEVSETRWLLVEQPAKSIPEPVLILIVFWLTLLFASFGLVAPKNLTATVVLFVCVVAASSGIAIVLEMDTPFAGIIRISSAPIHHALEVINH
jgi:hypothetical protein